MSLHAKSLRTCLALALVTVAACSDSATAPTLVDPAATNLQANADAQRNGFDGRDDDRRDGGQAEVLSRLRVRAATGKTIAEWGALWWKWAFDNPQVLGDLDGTYSALGDVGGPVFFAQGSGGEAVRANVIVPGGQYILLPVATYVWTFFDPCAALACARQIVNRNFINGITSVSVTVDGEDVRNMQAHLVRVDNSNPSFTVDAGPIDEDGYGGILPAVQGGYWLMLEPLPPGMHRVSMSATVPGLDPVTGERLGEFLHLETTLRLQASRRRHGG